MNPLPLVSQWIPPWLPAYPALSLPSPCPLPWLRHSHDAGVFPAVACV